MRTVDLKTTIAGVALTHPIYNAAGIWCAQEKELLNLAKSESAALLVKSATLKPRPGNPLPRWAMLGDISINSIGIANLGYQQYLKIFPRLKKAAKPVIASVSGLTLAHSIKIVKAYSNSESLDLIELNLSCPNLAGKAQVGYDFAIAKKYLEEIGKQAKKKWGIKLPPYFDESHYQEMAKIINHSKASYIVCVNTLGNGLLIDWQKEETLIKPNRGFGGIGGKLAKPFGLAAVRKFRQLLRNDINIVGVGGITAGRDVFEYILAGADAVQLGTVLAQEGLSAIMKIKNQLEKILLKKNYKKLEDFRGKLKEKF